MEPKGLNAIPLPNEVGDHYHHGVQAHSGFALPGFLKNLKQDDIILLAVIILLITESDANDKILIGILAYLFISGLDGNIFGL